MLSHKIAEILFEIRLGSLINGVAVVVGGGHSSSSLFMLFTRLTSEIRLHAEQFALDCDCESC